MVAVWVGCATHGSTQLYTPRTATIFTLRYDAGLPVTFTGLLRGLRLFYGLHALPFTGYGWFTTVCPSALLLLIILDDDVVTVTILRYCYSVIDYCYCVVIVVTLHCCYYICCCLLHYYVIRLFCPLLLYLGSSAAPTLLRTFPFYYPPVAFTTTLVWLPPSCVVNTFPHLRSRLPRYTFPNAFPLRWAVPPPPVCSYTLLLVTALLIIAAHH